MRRAFAPAATLAAALTLASSPAGAQSFNLDFGKQDGAHGLPAASYAAAGRPGPWQAIDAANVSNLVSLFGDATSVGLSLSGAPTFIDCDPTAISGDDAALLGDRVVMSDSNLAITISGLEPGRYALHLYGVAVSSPCPAFDPAAQQIDSGPESAALDGSWSGAFVEGESVASLSLMLPLGGDVTLSLFGSSACCPLQLSGMQIDRRTDLTSFCFGDGTGAPCPCGNPGQAGRGCAGSNGSGSWLEGTGTTSVATDDLRFVGHGMLPGQAALLIAGHDAVAGGAGRPFGDGLRCAGGSEVRLGVALPSDNGIAQWGPSLQPLGAWGVGDTRRFQGWYRDPQGSPCGGGFNLTQGIEAYFVP